LKGAEHSSTFSALATAKAKIILLGSSGPLSAALIAEVRSLNLEHVSPALLVQQEISRRTPIGQQAEQALTRGSAVRERIHLALLRKWFWARKPDAGFFLENFPATLLQALVLDEWLEARGENLTACFATPSASADVYTHYRTQGVASATLHAAA
jgi:adenylate kinase